MTIPTNNGHRVRERFHSAAWRKIKAMCAMCFGIVFLSAPCAAQTYRSDAFTYAIGAMKHSVTSIICPHQTSPTTFTPIAVGTAFFISSKGDFITADHVLQAFGAGQEFAGCVSQIAFAKPLTAGRFDDMLFRFDIADCVRDAALDISRCHSIENLTTNQGGKFEPTPVTIDPDVLDDGSAVAFTGFPLGTPIPVSARGYIGGYQLDVLGPVQMIIDRAAWPGASGSPVFDYRGRVVGIMVSAGANLASGISYAKTGYALAQFLSAHPLAAK